MVVRTIIQARVTSTRLPAKVLLTLGGYPLVVLAALRASRSRHEVVIATSNQTDDDAIVVCAAAAGVRVVRGPLDDTLARFVLAAEGLDDDDIVVRLTADNVVPDADLVDELVDAMRAGNHEYARIGGADKKLPYGVSAEAFTAKILREANMRAMSSYDREHVTPWIRRNTDDTAAQVADTLPEWEGKRCTIDSLYDFVSMTRVFADISDPVGLPWRELTAHVPGPPARVGITLGTVQLGVEYGAANERGLPTDEESIDVLRSAVECGISAFDTGRAYGLSEARIGVALRRGLSEMASVVTKVAPLDDLPLDASDAWIRASVQASLEASRRELGLSKLDTVLTHRASDWARQAVKDELLRQRDDGLIGAVGVSLATPEELVKVLTDSDVTYVQLPFNLLDDRWLQQEAQESIRSRPDATIAVRSVLLQGLLTLGEHVRWPLNAPLDKEEVQRIVDTMTVDFHRSSATDLALAYVRSFDWVDTVVIGAETPAQIHQLAGYMTRPALSADEQARARAALAPRAGILVDPSKWEQ